MKRTSLPLPRRELIALLGGAALAWPITTGAQPQPKMLRVGFVGIQPRGLTRPKLQTSHVALHSSSIAS